VVLVIRLNKAYGFLQQAVNTGLEWMMMTRRGVGGCGTINQLHSNAQLTQRAHSTICQQTLAQVGFPRQTQVP